MSIACRILSVILVLSAPLGGASKTRGVDKTENVVYFAMYEPRYFSLWTFCDRSRMNRYSAALWLIHRLNNHRWRVPIGDARARVVVVPALLDWLTDPHGDGCNRSIITKAMHTANLTATIAAADVTTKRTVHFIIGADFHSYKLGARIVKKLKVYLGVIALLGTYLHRFEAQFRMHEACRLGVGFLATPDIYESRWRSVGLHAYSATDVTARRRYRVEFMGQVDQRGGYRERWALFHAKHHLPKGSSVVFTSTPKVLKSAKYGGSAIPQCPKVESDQWVRRAGELHYCHVVNRLGPNIAQLIRAETTYSLFLRGDDEGSDRMYNALAALQIPLVVGARPGKGHDRGALAWLPFPTVINWTALVVHVPYEDFMVDPAAAVDTAIRNSEHGEERIRRNIVRAYPDFLWSVMGSRVHENILAEVVLHANECREAWQRGDF